MSDLGKIIKQGSFYNKMCGFGTITLRGDRIQASCPRGQTSLQFMLHEITLFRMTKRGIYIDNFYFRIDDITEWMKAILQALDAHGIQYEANGYHII